ncbi:MAG: DNA polymerase III subunit alpha [Ignavibacteriaceae bacterium]
MSDFIHLHNHSHYSLQDGACTVDDLIAAAKNNGMKSVALTDHGVMYGISEFYRKAKKEGIKPIVGMEAYVVAEGSRFDKSKPEDSNGRRKSKHYHHLLLLAKNEQGYKNLSRLSTLGHTEGFYYKPRIDLELIKQYRDGLICTSACASGVVSVHLINKDYETARKTALIYKEIFGDDFYLEIQNHHMEMEKAVLEGMPKLAKELDIRLVATNDCHYIEKDHSTAHNILLLLSDKTGADYRQLRYGTDQIYFKTAAEMKQLFKNHPEAIESTLEIDDKINLELDFSLHHFPTFPIPQEAGTDKPEIYFERLARERLSKKFPELTAEVEERFNFELKTINEMGFAGYFLIVQDFINAAKKMNIPVGPGRGSVAGSLVAYVLGITKINPLEHKLLFERFLNPERRSMPDIDVDFSDDKRSEVIEYVKKKYGNNSVSQIITFNRLSSKAVIRDVARVLKIPIQTVNKITKYIPSKFGKVYTIDQALNEVPELKWVRQSDDPQIKDLIRYARILEGMNRNASKHAAGIVITPSEVSNYVPLANAVSQNDIVTQYNMKEIENSGLLKMDFLGLRTLTIIRDTIDLIEKNHDVKIEIDDIPFNDEKTFQLFSKGQTTGIFQFESAPMREYLKRLKPTSLSDLCAMNALYRPGPMDFIDEFIERKSGKKNVEYLHPVLEPILKETYGIIVYQEQVIQIANKVAGLSLAEADILRRAMGKKDLAAMKQQKEKFIQGAVKNNIDKSIAQSIFEAIDKFANYGFNKSHAVAYSYIAYQTAYLKAYYPAEFLAANLKNEFGNSDKVTRFLEDCRKLKIQVLPPDVNNPAVYFDVEGGVIRFGMSAIKNVGIVAVEEIIRARKNAGRNFTSIFDFCTKVDTRVVNKRVLEGLVLAGAFDSVDKNRARTYNVIESALDFGHKVQNSKLLSSESLFGEIQEEIIVNEPSPPDTEDWSMKEKLAREREVTGYYISGHPLRKYETLYYAFANIKLGETEHLDDEAEVSACGVITELKTKIDKSGNTMAFFKLDDFYGSCECIMFSKIYEQCGVHLKTEEVVLINGRLESSGDSVKLHVENLIPIEQARNEICESVSIIIDRKSTPPECIDKLNNIISENEGRIPLFIHLAENGSNERLFELPKRISLNDDFIGEVCKLLGNEALRIYRK